MGRGIFITFEGVEGCGKSTQAALLKERLEAKGRRVLALREPGGTALGEAVRSILVNPADEPIEPMAELFLYEACRAQIVSRVIRPALAEEGSIVICDRFIDSTVAYQACARGLSMKDVSLMNLLATGGLVPDRTILLDIDVEAGLKRALERSSSGKGPVEDRFEKEAVSFHRKVREGYLLLAANDPRFSVVDAGREIPSIHKEICDIIDKMI